MKKLRTLALCAAAIALTSCAADAPQLLNERNAGAIPVTASTILVEIEDQIFDSPLLGTQGHAYVTGLRRGIQNTPGGVPTRFIDVNSIMLAEQIPSELRATRPSHTLRLFTRSAMQRGALPISVVWEMELSKVAFSPLISFIGFPNETVRTIPVYEASAEGDACLLSDTDADKCGEAMGKLLGDTLRAAHVLQTDAGT